MTKRRSKTSESKTDAKPKETKVEFLASLAGVLATGLFIIAFVVQAFAIPSSSMENTLLVGDHVFVNRIQNAPATSWARSVVPYDQIHRGDIIVFLSPKTPGLHVVKRIIGVPGDKIHLRNGVVYRNGQKLDEPYVLHDPGESFNAYRDDFPAVPHRRSTPISGTCGGLVYLRLLRATTSLSHQTPTLEWAITEA